MAGRFRALRCFQPHRCAPAVALLRAQTQCAKVDQAASRGDGREVRCGSRHRCPTYVSARHCDCRSGNRRTKVSRPPIWFHEVIPLFTFGHTSSIFPDSSSEKRNQRFHWLLKLAGHQARGIGGGKHEVENLDRCNVDDGSGGPGVCAIVLRGAGRENEEVHHHRDEADYDRDDGSQRRQCLQNANGSRDWHEND
jgi:hypothetical protein